MYSADYLWELLKMGWLSNVPLAIGSIISIAVFFERLKNRGLWTAALKVAGLNPTPYPRRSIPCSQLPTARVRRSSFMRPIN